MRQVAIQNQGQDEQKQGQEVMLDVIIEDDFSYQMVKPYGIFLEIYGNMLIKITQNHEMDMHQVKLQ